MAKFDECMLLSIVFAFMVSGLILAQFAEAPCKRRFPVGGPFIAITLVFVPSIAIGIWVAIAVMRMLH